MKNGLLILICCLGLYFTAIGQPLLPSSKGDVYNWDIGDTLEYLSDSYINSPQQPSLYSLKIVLDKSLTNGNYVYQFKRFKFYNHFFTVIGIDTIQSSYGPITNTIDPSLPYYPCAPSTDTCIRVQIVDSVPNNGGMLKQNYYDTYHPSLDERLKLVYVDGVGQTQYYYNCASYPFSPSNRNVSYEYLKYCSRVNGLIFGTAVYPNDPNAISDIIGKIDFSISPNPATNQLNISIDESLVGAQLNIYNITGALVQTVLLSTANSQVSTGNLPNGVYLAEIKTKEAPIIRRWVKM